MGKRYRTISKKITAFFLYPEGITRSDNFNVAPSSHRGLPLPPFACLHLANNLRCPYRLASPRFKRRRTSQQPSIIGSVPTVLRRPDTSQHCVKNIDGATRYLSGLGCKNFKVPILFPPFPNSFSNFGCQYVQWKIQGGLDKLIDSLSISSQHSRFSCSETLSDRNLYTSCPSSNHQCPQ